jgi:hypothetical protein
MMIIRAVHLLSIPHLQPRCNTKLHIMLDIGITSSWNQCSSSGKLRLHTLFPLGKLPDSISPLEKSPGIALGFRSVTTGVYAKASTEE